MYGNRLRKKISWPDLVIYFANLHWDAAVSHLAQLKGPGNNKVTACETNPHPPGQREGCKEALSTTFSITYWRTHCTKLTSSSKVKHSLLTSNYFPFLYFPISEKINQKVSAPLLQPPGDTAPRQAAQNMLRCAHMHKDLSDCSVEELRLLLGKNPNTTVVWLLSFVQAWHWVP